MVSEQLEKNVKKIYLSFSLTTTTSTEQILIL